MEKKRILIFSSAYFPFVGGAEVAVKEITNRLGGEYVFDVITARMRRDLPTVEKIGAVTVHRVGVGVSLVDKLWLPLGGAHKAHTLHTKNPYALFWVMMVSYAGGAAYILNWFLKHKVPIVLTIQEGDSEEHLTKRWFGLLDVAWQRAIKHARVVSAISVYLADRARRYGANRVVVVPNGVDIDRFEKSDSRAARRTLGIPESAQVIVTTSRLVRKNGVDIVIRALPTLPGVLFLVAGDGPERVSLESLARERGVSERVRFLGSVPYEKVHEVVAAGDVFVRASRSEGMGNSFLEAMAMGTPVVGTNVGGIPDFLTDALKHPTHGTGLMVPPENPTALGAALGRLLHDVSLRSALSNRARTFVRQRYAWGGIAEEMHAVFARALTEKDPLKVLITTGLFPPESGGPATYSKILLQQLPAHDFEVSVLPFRVVRKFPNVLRHIAYTALVLWRGRNFDMLYAQDTTSVGWPTRVVNVLLRKKFVVRVPGDQVWEQAVQRFGVSDVLDDFPVWSKHWHPYVMLLRFLQQLTVKGAQKIIVPSHYLGRIVAGWDIPKKNIVTVYNGIESREVGLKQVIRGLLKFRGELVVSTGRLVPWKGFDTLIRMHAKMQKSRPELKLLIVGGGPELERLERLAESLKVADSVLFTGAVENAVALRYMRAADVFVLNTSYEGFSHTLLEAATVGVPIVTTDIGGNPEFIDNGANGYLVKPNDEKKLIERIEALLDSPELRAKISASAKRKVEKFSVARMVTETAELLKSVYR